MERGLKKGAGYVLVDVNGDKPLGTDYTASLDDIDRFLNDFADDAGIDVAETSRAEPIKPLSLPQIKFEGIDGVILRGTAWQ
jgi:hypothetical protein